jgi:hypothetical protein
MSDFSYAVETNQRNTYFEVYQTVSVREFSFALVPFNGTKFDRVETCLLYSRQNQIVSSSIENLNACASNTYDPTKETFLVSSSNEPNCYPLLDLATIVTKSKYETSSTRAKANAIAAGKCQEDGE